MGVYVIHADNENFNVAVGATHLAQFAIPQGVFTSAQWDQITTQGGSGSSPDLEMSTAPSGSQVQTATYADVTPVAASAGQISDINAAAGTNLLVTVFFNGSGTLAKHFSAFTLTLTGTLCAYTISPSSAAYPSSGGGGGIGVTTTGSCPWSASTAATWIAITNPTGTGNGTCNYTVAPNLGGARSATISIAGYSFLVTQATGVCTYALTPANVALDATAHPGLTIAVATQGVCPWTAACPDAWITFAAASGAGSGTVIYNVAVNAGVGRNSTITVNGIAFPVSQQGISCTFGISPVSETFGALGGADVFSILTQLTCAWTAISNAGWISVTSAASGTGMALVAFTVAPNTGTASARVGTITAAGLTYTVSQMGGQGGGFAVLAPANLPCINGTTRPVMRDRIRRAMGITPPSDTQPLGVVGEPPLGQPTPTNAEINQAITDGISWLNEKVKFAGSTSVSMSIPAATANGIQFVSLTGVGTGSGSNQNNVNSIQKAVWNPGSGSALIALRATDAAELDRLNLNGDNYPPAVPRVYLVERYQIGLLPAAQAAGTLLLYAGLSVYNFCSDTDVLNILPVDYELVLESVVVLFLSQRRPQEPSAMSRIQFLGGNDGTGETSGMVAAGITQLAEWYNDTLPQQQKSIGLYNMRRGYGLRRIRR